MWGIRYAADGNLLYCAQMNVLISSGLFSWKIPDCQDYEMEPIHVQGCVKLLITTVKSWLRFFLTTFVHFPFRGGKEATIWGNMFIIHTNYEFS